MQFVKAPSSGRGVSSGRGPKSTSVEKTEIPKSRQTVAKGASKSQPSRWIEKLTQEEKNKRKKQQHLQQKILKNVKEKPVVKSKDSKSSLMLPGTTHKTVSTTAKNTVSSIKNKRNGKLGDEIRAAVLSAPTSIAATASAAAGMPYKVSKGKCMDSRNQLLSEEGQTQTVTDAQGRAKELAEVEELEWRLNQQVSHCRSSSSSVCLQQDGEQTACGDILLSIHSYLEACVFVEDLERAHSFLLSQHRVRSRRKHLKTSVYNTMMRVWAKKVSSRTKMSYLRTEVF